MLELGNSKPLKFYNECGATSCKKWVFIVVSLDQAYRQTTNKKSYFGSSNELSDKTELDVSGR